MAVNRHITASAHQGGNFKAGRLPTITLSITMNYYEISLLTTHSVT